MPIPQKSSEKAFREICQQVKQKNYYDIFLGFVMFLLLINFLSF
jgi:hypothetical protein